MGETKKGMEMSSSFMAESKIGYCLNMRDFTGSLNQDSALPMQGTPVPSLVGELRPHMLCGMARKKENVNMKFMVQNWIMTAPLHVSYNPSYLLLLMGSCRN